MANNDYWAYLREENELRHSRPEGVPNKKHKYKSIINGRYIYEDTDTGTGGKQSHSSKEPVGIKTNGYFKSLGNKIGNDIAIIKRGIKNTSDKIKESTRKAAINIRSKLIGSTRTSYGDMKSGNRGGLNMGYSSENGYKNVATFRNFDSRLGYSKGRKFESEAEKMAFAKQVADVVDAFGRSLRSTPGVKVRDIAEAYLSDRGLGTLIKYLPWNNENRVEKPRSTSKIPSMYRE